MAHEKVYGICENKCKVLVMPGQICFIKDTVSMSSADDNSIQTGSFVKRLFSANFEGIPDGTFASVADAQAWIDGNYPNFILLSSHVFLTGSDQKGELTFAGQQNAITKKANPQITNIEIKPYTYLGDVYIAMSVGYQYNAIGNKYGLGFKIALAYVNDIEWY